MGKQLFINFEDNKIEEVTGNTLRVWCIKNNMQYILEEWAYDLNGDVTPDNVTPKNGRVVWWRCKNNSKHVWQAAVSKRTNGGNCPYCINQKILVGDNDLATTNPELIPDWYFEKNYPLEPTQVTRGSDKRVWWKCSKCGHSWPCSIYSRTTLKTGCPECGKDKRWSNRMSDLVSTKGSIYDLYYDVIETEWSYELNAKEGLDPKLIVVNSNKRAWWICQYCGKPYKQIINKHLVDNLGHYACTRDKRTSMPEKVISFYLKKEFSDLIENYRTKDLNYKELDIYIPSLKLAIEYDGDAWHRDINKDLIKDNLCNQLGIFLIRIREGNNPIYETSAKLIHCEKNYASLKYIENALLKIIEIINNKYELKIKMDYDIDRDYPMILESYSSSKKENSIEQDSTLLKYWDCEGNGNLKPFMISKGSNKKICWKCPDCNYMWKQSVFEMYNKKYKCTRCYKVKRKNKEL